MSDEGPGAPIEDTLTEAAFVGCLLLSPASEAARLLDLADDSDFAAERHRLALLAVRAIIADETDPDPVVVNAWLRREGHAAPYAPTDVGVWLCGLVELPTTRAGATHYLRSVVEHAWRRRIQRAGARLTQAAGSESVGGLQDLLDAELTAVAAVRARLDRLDQSRLRLVEETA